MAKPNCKKCIHKAVCDNYEQWIGDITGFENIRAAKCPYFQESGWISVEDRLPEGDSTQVLMTDGEYCYISSRNNMVRFLDCDGVFIPGKSGAGVRVTHWMPLPEPPKEENKG